VSKETEADIVRRATAGDPAAITTLYERYVDTIYRYVRYRVDDDETARDITADVFVRALESLSRYDERNVPFAAWLYRIGHARVVDHWRRLARRSEESYDDLGDHTELTTDAEALDQVDVIEHNSVRAALMKLTPEQQEALILKYVQGLSNAEISEITGRTVGAVKALQHRGLAALARLLDEEES